MDVKKEPDEELLSSNTAKNSYDGRNHQNNMNDIRNEEDSINIKCESIVNHNDVMNGDKDHYDAEELKMDIKKEPDDELVSSNASKNSYDGDNHQINTKDICNGEQSIDIKYEAIVSHDEIITEDNYNQESEQITSKFPTTGVNSAAYLKLPIINSSQQQSVSTVHIDNTYVKNEILQQEVVAVILVENGSFHKRNFVCSVCFELFPSLKLLKQHKTVHINLKTKIGKLINKSFRCKRVSADSKTVQIDNIYHSNENPYKCEKCDLQFKRAMAFKVHEKTHSTVKTFKCDQCRYAGKSAEDLSRHSELHNSDSPYKCDQCSFVSKRAYRIKDHKLTHSTEKPFECDQCDYKTITAWNLKSHQRRHSTNKKFKCDQCSYKTGISWNLKIHQATHTARKIFGCDECSLKFSSAVILKEHKITHNSERPFKCDQCDSRFKRFCNFKSHQFIHSSERPFKCDRCNYTCKRSSALSLHSKMHNNVYPFKCDQCLYESKYAPCLKRHKLRHSNERPFNCGHCDYRAKQKDDLKAHIKCIHKTIL